jgi:uncharacterized protein with PIN domain
MAGLGIRLFTDEMINPRLATRLRRLGYDVESCQQAGRANQRISDHDQLVYAASQARAILTFNAGDFELLDRRWKVRGWQHSGIVVSAQIIDLAELTRRMQLHLDTVAPAVQQDSVLELVS